MFDSKIEEFINHNQRAYRDRPPTRHYPSEASLILGNGDVIGRCHRQSWYKRKGYYPDKLIGAKNLRIMKIGKSIEQIEIGFCKSMGIYLDDDLALENEVRGMTISGKIDAIYVDEYGKAVCVEYKTTSGYTFASVAGKIRRLKAGPKPEHALQVMLYLDAISWLEYGLIFYINRRDAETMEHKVEILRNGVLINGEPEEYTMQGIYDRYEELTKYLESNTLPPCDYTPEYDGGKVEDLNRRGKVSNKAMEEYLNTGIAPCHWVCGYACDYRKTCIKDERKMGRCQQ
jgi:hypothetical protein